MEGSYYIGTFGPRYNGTQALIKANVVKFPKVRWTNNITPAWALGDSEFEPLYTTDPRKFGLVCLEIGIIDLKARKIQRTEVTEVKSIEPVSPPLTKPAEAPATPQVVPPPAETSILSQINFEILNNYLKNV